MKKREKVMECPGCGLRLPDQQIERPHRYFLKVQLAILMKTL